MTAPLRGDEYKLYRDTASLPGGYASPTWNICDTLTSVDPKIGMSPLESKVRAANANQTVLGKFDLSLTIVYEDRHDDADLLAFIAAAIARTPLHLAIADGAIATAGTVYRHAVWVITEWSKPENDNEIAVHTFTLMPHETQTYPFASVTVS